MSHERHLTKRLKSVRIRESQRERKDKTMKRDNNKRDKDNNKDNNIIIQVTLFDKENRHKPVSTLVEVESIEYFNNHSQEVKTRAIQKICLKRYWTGQDLKKYGYTSVKVRNYTLYQEIINGQKEARKEGKER